MADAEDRDISTVEWRMFQNNNRNLGGHDGEHYLTLSALHCRQFVVVLRFKTD
jgi:hypothetical protein